MYLDQSDTVAMTHSWGRKNRRCPLAKVLVARLIQGVAR